MQNQRTRQRHKTGQGQKWKKNASKSKMDKGQYAVKSVGRRLLPLHHPVQRGVEQLGGPFEVVLRLLRQPQLLRRVDVVAETTHNTEKAGKTNRKKNHHHGGEKSGL